MRATRAQVHLGVLKKNVEAIRAYIGSKPLICMVVKTDAYGHGAVKVAEEGLRAGAAFLGVATVDEGAELRKAGISAPIFLFSIPSIEELDALVSNKITPFISDGEFAEAVNSAAGKAGIKLPVHIKIDTGMGRVGCRPEDAAKLALYITSLKSLHYEGTLTHFARADSKAAEAINFTKKQLVIFNEALEEIRKAGLDTGIVHAANSGAILLHKDSYFDMVRPGVILYGSPTDELTDICPTKPVMELVSYVSFIKKVKKGTPISYNGTWTAPEDRIIGTIPIGYGDGLPRRLTNNYQVLIAGKLYPLVGNICMDQCMVDLGAVSDVNRWEKVTVFGGNEGALHASDIASKANTILQEVTCGINKRVPRIYFN